MKTLKLDPITGDAIYECFKCNAEVAEALVTLTMETINGGPPQIIDLCPTCAGGLKK